MSDFRQFSEESIRKIQRDHSRLKAMSESIAAQQQVERRESDVVRTVTGYTSTNSANPTYPTTGDTYVVKLKDYYFQEQAGTRARTATGDFSKSIIARTWDGSKLVENTPVICDLVFCVGKGYRWWIRPIPAAATTGAQIWTKAASRTTTFSWKFFQSGSSTEDTTSPIEITTDGVYCFPCFFYGTNSNSSGTVFTFNSSPSGFQGGNAINFQQPAYFALTVHTTWRLPPLSESTFNSHFRVASHGHQVTVSGTTYNTTNTTINAQATDSKRGVTVETFANGHSCGTSTIPHFYSTADNPFDYRWATHSGVALINYSGTNPPSAVKIFVQRKTNTTDFIGQGELDTMSLTLEQISDIAT
jgi:hypothetical protein